MVVSNAMFFKHKSRIRPFLSTLFSLVVLVTASGCTKEVAQVEAPGPALAARVNDDEITREALDRELDRIDQSFPVKTEEAGSAPLAEEVLRQMIRRRLLLQEAAAQKIGLSPEAAQRFVSERKGGISKEDLEARLKSTGTTYKEWERRILDDRRIDLLIEQVIDPAIQITDEELRELYESNGESFQMPARVKVRQIVVAKEEDADRVRKRLHLHEEDFAQVAAESSLSPDAAQGGDIGIFAPGQMPPEFDQVCFSLEIGEISPVVRSDYGYHIFRVDKRFPAGRIPFEEARENLYNQLFLQRREEALLQYQQELWDRSEITLLLEGR